MRLRIGQGQRPRGRGGDADQALADAKRPVCTSDEVLEYVWDDKTTKEQPRKENDHGMDAMRYAVAALDLVGRPRFRSFYTSGRR